MFVRTSASRAVLRRVTAGYPIHSWGQMSTPFFQKGGYHDAVSILTTDHKEVVGLIDKLLHSLETEELQHDTTIPIYSDSGARMRERGK